MTLLTLFFIFLLSCILLPLCILIPILYYHSQASQTPFQFQSYQFDPENERIPEEEGCILLKSEMDSVAAAAGGNNLPATESTTSGTAESLPIYMSFIVPAYNEENRITRMLTQTLTYCRNRFEKEMAIIEKEKSPANSRPVFTFEIIVVDDGSRDKTRSVVEKFLEEHNVCNASRINCIRLLPLIQNRGKGFAVKQGVLRARGQRILMLDADGASEITDMEKLEGALDAMAEQDRKNSKGTTPAPSYNVALGSRRALESDADRHWFRDFISRVFNFLVKYISGIHSIKDTQCGFKMFERAAARYLFINQHVERWCFDIDILILCQYHKDPPIQVREVPIRWQEIEGSHLNIWGLIGILRDLFLIRLYYELGLWVIRGSNGSVERKTPFGQEDLWIDGYEDVNRELVKKRSAGRKMSSSAAESKKQK